MLGRRRVSRPSGNSSRASSSGLLAGGGELSADRRLFAGDDLPRNGDWSGMHDAAICRRERSWQANSIDGDRRRISERGRCGGDIVPLALRAAAGAALSLLHGRRFCRRFPRRDTEAAQCRRETGADLRLARLRAWLLDRLRGARRRRLDNRPPPARLAGAAGDGRRRAHHPDGTEFPRRDPQNPASVARGAVPGGRQARKRDRAPTSWGWPSPSAGRPALVRCSGRS